MIRACIFALFCVVVAGASAQEETVRVEFIDGGTKKVFGVSDMPVAKLPEKFDAGTMLDIQGQKWMVLSADPAAKGDFVKSGKLSLVLSNTSKAFPAGTLFSMPSVSGGVGNVKGSAPPGENIFSIHENDWRQVEFVSTGYEKEIDAEFADIHNVRVNEHKPGGYSDLFVRERVEAPVRDLTLREVRELFPQAKQFDAVGFLHERGTVPRSFAWAMDEGLVVWGVTDEEGDVITLCLAGAPAKEHIAAISAALAKFVSRYDLYLVDWCGERRVRGDAADFEKYFGL